MNPYLQILRPHNCLVAGVAVIIAALITAKIFSPVSLIAALVAFLVCGAGNAINDYYDIEIDKINRPKRPLPSGRIHPRNAMKYILILYSSGIFISIFINIYAFIIAAFNSVVSYLYAWKIKNKGGIWKSLTVSYLVASPFFFGGIAVGSPTVTIILSILAGFANTAREIIKDIEDLEGDKKFANTLPAAIGPKKASVIAGISIITGALISPMPYLMGILNQKYLIAVSVADIIFIYSIILLKHPGRESARKSQKTIKAGMIVALFAFVIGIF